MTLSAAGVPIDRKDQLSKRSDSMSRITATKAKREFGDMLNRVVYQGEEVEIQRRGKSVAAIIPLALYSLIRQIEDEADLKAIRKRLNE
mgnify:FL=1